MTIDDLLGEIERLKSLCRFQDNVIRSGNTACLTQEEQYALSEAAKSFAFDEDDEECLRISSTLSSLLERLQ